MGKLEDHECQPDVMVAYQREQFDSQFATFMASKEGKFARFYAERQGDVLT